MQYETRDPARNSGSDAHVEFLTVVYPPGADSCDEDSLVRHGGKEYGYVLSGRLRVTIGFESYELRRGDSISFDCTEPHRPAAGGLSRSRDPFGAGGCSAYPPGAAGDVLVLNGDVPALTGELLRRAFERKLDERKKLAT